MLLLQTVVAQVPLQIATFPELIALRSTPTFQENMGLTFAQHLLRLIILSDEPPALVFFGHVSQLDSIDCIIERLHDQSQTYCLKNFRN